LNTACDLVLLGTDPWRPGLSAWSAAGRGPVPWYAAQVVQPHLSGFEV